MMFENHEEKQEYPPDEASLTPPHLNEVHARSHESDQDVRGERSCICMLGVRGHVYGTQEIISYE
jgi:hypothetical protein